MLSCAFAGPAGLVCTPAESSILGTDESSPSQRAPLRREGGGGGRVPGWRPSGAWQLLHDRVGTLLPPGGEGATQGRRPERSFTTIAALREVPAARARARPRRREAPAARARRAAQPPSAPPALPPRAPAARRACTSAPPS